MSIGEKYNLACVLNHNIDCINTLTISWQHSIDIVALICSSLFVIFGENGVRLGETSPTDRQCGNGVTTVPVTAAQLQNSLVLVATSLLGHRSTSSSKVVECFVFRSQVTSGPFTSASLRRTNLDQRRRRRRLQKQTSQK